MCKESPVQQPKVSGFSSRTRGFCLLLDFGETCKVSWGNICHEEIQTTDWSTVRERLFGGQINYFQFANYFQYARSIHEYNTRYASKQNLYKPKEGSSTNPGKQSVAFSATVLWDNIPVDLKT